MRIPNHSRILCLYFFTCLYLSIENLPANQVDGRTYEIFCQVLYIFVWQLQMFQKKVYQLFFYS